MWCCRKLISADDTPITAVLKGNGLSLCTALLIIIIIIIFIFIIIIPQARRVEHAHLTSFVVA
jgi:uncharacterized membrane protein